MLTLAPGSAQMKCSGVIQAKAGFDLRWIRYVADKFSFHTFPVTRAYELFVSYKRVAIWKKRLQGRGCFYDLDAFVLA